MTNMTKTIAFLRAINVGGHNVKMESLRALFEQLGFDAVETFIASGNVVFETDAAPDTALEAAIEAHLKAALERGVGGRANGHRRSTFGGDRRRAAG